ncbi:hypothetical protein HanRHA438_Chr06g0266111 [Helianthus annuus]|nr:hypothetical protein HanRHA438_Chr06g0266111 [Helianthus annuus]
MIKIYDQDFYKFLQFTNTCSFNAPNHNLDRSTHSQSSMSNNRFRRGRGERNQITDQDSDSLESTMGNIRMMILSTICNEGEGDLLTPEKRLLNSIEIVERVVMEELNRLKRTPAAEKAEREKKVRTLMSMR